MHSSNPLAGNYLSGVVWSAVNAAAVVLVPFGIFVFFARQAGPAVIGLVALAVACTDVLKTLGMQGIYEALLPRMATDRRYHETAAAVLLGGGLAVMVAYGAVLSLLALFEVNVRAHLLALAFVGLRIPFDLLTLQPQAALAQRLSYRRLAMRSLIASLLAGAAGAAVTLLVRPLDGLIVYQVLQSALLLLITALGGGLLARPRWHRDCYNEMMREGWWSTSVRFVAANVANLDQIIVASIAGSTPLAYFNLGKRIETSFVSVAGSFTNVVFQPLFARHATLPPADTMRRSLAVLAVVCAVPAACFIADGRLLVGMLFGATWLQAVGVTQILALSGAIKAIGCVPGALLSVCGRNRQLFSIAVVSALGTAAAALFLTPFAIVWCAVGLLVKNALSIVWLAWVQRDLVPRPLRLYGAAAVVPFALALGVTVGMVRIGPWLGLPPLAASGPGLAGGLVGQLAWLALAASCGLAVSGVYLVAYLRIDLLRLARDLRGRLGTTPRAPVHADVQDAQYRA